MFENAKILNFKLATLALSVMALLALAGCETSQSHFADVAELANQATNTVHSETIILREGDTFKVTFPGAPDLNRTVTIRRDGNVALPLIGEIRAADKTPAQLKAELVKLYAGQVESKELSVEVVTDQFPVFVTGAVLKPQKVMSDHPMTALEAIMECGGFDYAKANLKSVTVLRRENSHLVSYTLNFKDILQAREDTPFYMKPGDVIYVKERFNWF